MSDTARRLRARGKATMKQRKARIVWGDLARRSRKGMLQHPLGRMLKTPPCLVVTASDHGNTKTTVLLWRVELFNAVEMVV